VVESYGRERLPDLLQGLAAYDSWQELIPAVFDVSQEQFVSGWNLYVIEYYRLAQE
jgi:hypothetical protein